MHGVRELFMAGVIIEQADCCKYDFKEPADIVFCDPPQWEGENAFFNHHKSSFTEAWLKNIQRFIKPDGIFIIVTSPKWTYEYYELIMGCTLLEYYHQIVWYFQFGYYQSKTFPTNHMNILLFSTGKPIFQGNNIRIPSKRQLTGDERAQARGRVPGTVWDMPRLTNHHPERQGTGPQLPYLLVDRFLRAFGWKGCYVLDPFMGYGTVPLVCKHLSYRCRAIDINETCVKISQRRIGQLKSELTHDDLRKRAKLPTSTPSVEPLDNGRTYPKEISYE
jgi:DNA modification methylase